MSDKIKAHLSSRTLELLKQKKFVQKSADHPDSLWAIEYSGRTPFIQTDRILTLEYTAPSGDTLVDVFLETLCRLVIGKTVEAVAALSFREAENFLRDENHLPAFSPEIEGEARNVFYEVKLSLIQEIVLKSLSESASEIFSPRLHLGTEVPWVNLSLAGKNRILLNFFSWINGLFGKSPGIELILAEDDTVTVKNNDFPLEVPLVEGILNRALESLGLPSPLKVIGTL